ncbi:hypothetical protein [Paraconexibacter algicola]|uniref:Uncharacterized protein n=1 Tax=Paraconexibacter algicola TaxID=2133960 RepID=A0A2T4UGD0_9ACTN|nr:hypothetical protein [Paraconexibacter algicola]PTL58301.1 hypothetical protein C7Y72_00875 [Paraconexibacter algicola]
MSSPKTLIKRKAAKAVVAHTAHGTVSKVRRRPARATSLLGAGALLGAVVGYLLGRRGGGAPAAPHAAAPPVAPAPAPVAPPAGPAVTPVGSAPAAGA